MFRMHPVAAALSSTPHLRPFALSALQRLRPSLFLTRTKNRPTHPSTESKRRAFPRGSSLIDKKFASPSVRPSASTLLVPLEPSFRLSFDLFGLRLSVCLPARPPVYPPPLSSVRPSVRGHRVGARCGQLATRRDARTSKIGCPRSRPPRFAPFSTAASTSRPLVLIDQRSARKLDVPLVVGFFAFRVQSDGTRNYVRDVTAPTPPSTSNAAASSETATGPCQSCQSCQLFYRERRDCVLCNYKPVNQSIVSVSSRLVCNCSIDRSDRANKYICG